MCVCNQFVFFLVVGYGLLTASPSFRRLVCKWYPAFGYYKNYAVPTGFNTKVADALTAPYFWRSTRLVPFVAQDSADSTSHPRSTQLILNQK